MRISTSSDVGIRAFVVLEQIHSTKPISRRILLNKEEESEDAQMSRMPEGISTVR